MASEKEKKEKERTFETPTNEDVEIRTDQKMLNKRMKERRRKKKRKEEKKRREKEDLNDRFQSSSSFVA